MRAKLLEVIEGIELDDLAESALLDIVLNKIQTLQIKIKALEAENALEREKLYHDRLHLREEHKKLHSDPLYGAQGQYYYTDNSGNFYFLRASGGMIIDIIHWKKDYQIHLQQISRREWEEAIK